MPKYATIMKNAFRIVPVVENPRHILFLTLRHTGSFFFQQILVQQYFHWRPLMLHGNAQAFNSRYPSVSTEGSMYPPWDTKDFNPFVRIHTEWESTCLEYWNRCKLADIKPIVITLERDLKKVKESYIRRAANNSPMSFDQNISKQIGEVSFNETYTHHKSVLDQIKPDFILSVDADDKQERLDQLALTLGVPLTANWDAPVNQSS